MSKIIANLQLDNPSLDPSISTDNTPITTEIDVAPAVLTLDLDAPEIPLETALSFREVKLTGLVEKSSGGGGGAVNDVLVNGVSVVVGGVAKILVPTAVSQLQNDSGFITTSYHDDTKANLSTVEGIISKIPNDASAQNQLADKNFVNSSISTATATFKGTYDSLNEIEALTADDNDYAFYRHTDIVGNTVFDRYKYNGSTWIYEYTLNNSSFTAEQWAALNSGISAGSWVDLVSAQEIDGRKDFNIIPRVKVSHTTHNLPEEYQEVTYIQGNGYSTINTGVNGNNDNLVLEVKYKLNSVADQWRYVMGSYQSESHNTTRILLQYGNSILVNVNTSAGSSTTTAPFTRNTVLVYTDRLSKTVYTSNGQDVAITKTGKGTTANNNIFILAAQAGAANNGTATKGQIFYVKIWNGTTLIRDFIPCYRKSDNKTGMYDIENGVFYEVYGAQEFDVGDPVNPTSYENLLTDSSFATVAFTGLYSDLIATPTIGNGRLTIQKNGTNISTFDANQTGNVTANITVPTKTSELTNNSGFITSAAIPTNISSFTNDVGYITGYTETDPTVPSWAKAAQKPIYTASEVGAQAAPLVGQIDNDTADDYLTPAQIAAAVLNHQQVFAQRTVLSVPVLFTSWTGGYNAQGHGMVVSSILNGLMLVYAQGDITNEIWEVRLNFLVDEGSLGNFVTPDAVSQYETDPTVPEWAKESSKPTYTATEVGALPDTTTAAEIGALPAGTFIPSTAADVHALPDTTVIPTDTSDLTNNAGFITLNDLPIWDGGFV